MEIEIYHVALNIFGAELNPDSIIAFPLIVHLISCSD